MIFINVFIEAPTYELVAYDLKLFAIEDMQDPHEWAKFTSLDILGIKNSFNNFIL